MPDTVDVVAVADNNTYNQTKNKESESVWRQPKDVIQFIGAPDQIKLLEFSVCMCYSCWKL